MRPRRRKVLMPLRRGLRVLQLSFLVRPAHFIPLFCSRIVPIIHRRDLARTRKASNKTLAHRPIRMQLLNRCAAAGALEGMTDVGGTVWPMAEPGRAEVNRQRRLILVIGCITLSVWRERSGARCISIDIAGP
jgi:hypothetical protein